MRHITIEECLVEVTLIFGELTKNGLIDEEKTKDRVRVKTYIVGIARDFFNEFMQKVFSYNEPNNKIEISIKEYATKRLLNVFGFEKELSDDPEELKTQVKELTKIVTELQDKLRENERNNFSKHERVRVGEPSEKEMRAFLESIGIPHIFSYHS